MESIADYRKRLKSLRIKQLGTGYFSRVYQHPTLADVVVKMVVRRDPKYIEFAEKCRRTANPWLPKVFAIHHCEMLHRGRPTKVSFVFLERLKESASKDFETALEKISPSAQYFEDVRWKRVRHHRDPHIKEVAQLFTELEVNDLHEGNMMMRGTQLVFTDPVASGD